jgi:gas vesicle protein GvpL/GvpF
VIHLYAFADGLGELPRIAGVDGAALEQLPLNGVTTIFSRRSRTSEPAELRDDALTHGAVVDALTAEAAAVLPVRFGQVVADDAALARSVRVHAQAVRRNLDHVRGCVEIGLRVSFPAERVSGVTSGAEYMRQLRRVEEARRTTIEELHRRLASSARDSRVASSSLSLRDRFDAAYLVPREGVGDFQACVDAFARASEGMSVVCTGPWAPFSFSDVQAAA